LEAAVTGDTSSNLGKRRCAHGKHQTTVSGTEKYQESGCVGEAEADDCAFAEVHPHCAGETGS
jgi:hypothetical protein